MALIESVPNFSEGCDRAKVDAIADAMRMDGVYLLNQGVTRRRVARRMARTTRFTPRSQLGNRSTY